MTTPNAYTRTSLVDISARTTTALTALGRVMPHMRAVTNAATGPRASLLRRALAEAEQLEAELRLADMHAEAVKTLFRSATMTPGTGDAQAPCTPPGMHPAQHGGPAPHDGGGGAAALVRRQA